MGEEYQYVAYVITDSETNSIVSSIPDAQGNLTDINDAIVDIYPYGPSNQGYARLLDMNSVFLVDYKHQLRIGGNISLSNYRRVINEQFQTTLGSKYPYYSKNGETNYRTFSLTGIITINFDTTATFMRQRVRQIVEIETDLRKNFQMQLGWYVYRSGNNFDDNHYYYCFQSFNAKGDWEQDSAYLEQVTMDGYSEGRYWEDTDYESYEIHPEDLFLTEEFSISRRRVMEPTGGEWIGQFGEDGTSSNRDLPQKRGAKTIYDDNYNQNAMLRDYTLLDNKSIYLERKFRDRVMEWLSNAKPKLFRSATEGNMIVMISGATFTPFLSSRAVYEVNMTVTEIADYSTQSLKDYNIYPGFGIVSEFISTQPYAFFPGRVDD